MSLFSSKRQPKISREAMFNSKPTRNDRLEWKTNKDDEVTITLKRADTTKVKILSKIFWVPEKRTLVLDEIGSQVGKMCNGRTSVASMIKQLCETHKLNAKEAEISLLTYLRTLGRKNLLGFLVEKGDLKKRKRSASGKAWG